MSEVQVGARIVFKDVAGNTYNNFTLSKLLKFLNPKP